MSRAYQVIGLFMVGMIMIGCRSIPLLNESYEGPHTEAGLVAAFKVAHASRNPERLLEMFYLDDVDKESRVRLAAWVNEQLKQKIALVKIEPRPLDMPNEIEQNGVVFKPTLPVVGQLVVQYAGINAPGAKLLFGVYDDEYYFVTTVGEPLDR